MNPLWTPTDRLRPPLGVPVPMQQHPAYGAACAALGTKVAGLEIRRGNRVMASAQFLIRRWPLFGRFALLSRGPVWHPDLSLAARRSALNALIGHLRAGHRGVMATPDRISGADPLAGGNMLEMVGAGYTARLPVMETPEEQRAALDGKWRNRLRRAEAAGLELREGPMPADPGHWLLRAEALQARTRRYARLPPAFSAAWAARGGARLFSVWRQGQPQAGMLFLAHPPLASYHVGWTSEAGRAAHAHNLLLWRAMLWAQSEGLTALDLGTLDTESTPDLARFKLGTGAVPQPLGATRLSAPGTRSVAWMVRKWSWDPAPAPPRATS